MFYFRVVSFGSQDIREKPGYEEKLREERLRKEAEAARVAGKAAAAGSYRSGRGGVSPALGGGGAGRQMAVRVEGRNKEAAGAGVVKSRPDTGRGGGAVVQGGGKGSKAAGEPGANLGRAGGGGAGGEQQRVAGGVVASTEQRKQHGQPTTANA